MSKRQERRSRQKDGMQRARRAGQPRADVPGESVARLERRLPKLVDLVCLRIDELCDAVASRLEPDEQSKRMKELERAVRVAEKVLRFVVRTKAVDSSIDRDRPAPAPEGDARRERKKILNSVPPEAAERMRRAVAEVSRLDAAKGAMSGA